MYTIAFLIALIFFVAQIALEIMEYRDRKYGPVKHRDYTISGVMRAIIRDAFIGLRNLFRRKKK